ESGWASVPRPGERYDTCLVRDDVPDLFVELHWDLAASHERGNDLRAETLWKRRVAARMKGIDAFGLPPELELVALASHAGKPYHHFRRLMWSVDLAVVIDSATPALDWDEVAAIAWQHKCRTVLAVGLNH